MKIILAIIVALSASIAHAQDQAWAYSRIAKLSKGAVVVPRDSNTMVLLHLNGTDGETVFTDSSMYAHSFTNIGGAQLDTDQKKFGTASLLNTNTYGCVSTKDSEDFELQGVDFFTFEFRVRFYDISANGGYTMFFSKAPYDNVNNSYYCYYEGRGTPGIVLQTYDSGNDASYVYRKWDWSPTNNVFYHVALCKKYEYVRVFIDGSEIGAPIDFSSASFYNGPSDFTIGGQPGGDYFGLHGWIDEFRFSKGVARYTHNFTVQTSEFNP